MRFDAYLKRQSVVESSISIAPQIFTYGQLSKHTQTVHGPWTTVGVTGAVSHSDLDVCLGWGRITGLALAPWTLVLGLVEAVRYTAIFASSEKCGAKCYGKTKSLKTNTKKAL